MLSVVDFLHVTSTLPILTCPPNATTVNMPATQEIHLLSLTDQGAPDVPGEYIYLPPPSEPPYKLRFEIEGTSSICRQGSLWVNIPPPGGTFRRDKYQEYKWVLHALEYTPTSLDTPHV